LLDTPEQNNLGELYRDNIYKNNNGGYNLSKLQDQPFPIQDIDGSCYGTGKKDCIAFLKDCVIGNNTNYESCKTHFETLDNSEFDNIRSQVKNMHPAVVVKILKSFGFKKRESYDEIRKRSVEMVQDVYDWINNTGRPANEIAALRKNNNLLRFLNLLTQYINLNPGILNKGFSKSEIETFSKSYETNNYGKQFGLKARYEPINDERQTQIMQQNAMLLAAQNRQPVLTKQTITQIGLPMVGMNQGMSGLYGQYGGYGFGNNNSRFVIKTHNNPNVGINFVERQLEITIANLARMGKQLEPSIISKIKADIASARAYEDKAMRIVRIINEYQKLVELGQDNGMKSDYVTQERLDRLIGKGEKTQVSSIDCQNRIILALSKLENLASGADGVNHDGLVDL
jgi:hypothetical protein